MKKLIELSTGKTLYKSDEIVKLGGPNQWGLEEGRHAWLDVPSGEEAEDCVLSPDKSSLVVDTTLKAARVQKLTDESTKQAQLLSLKNRLDELDSLTDLTAVELKELARKLYKLIKLLR